MMPSHLNNISHLDGDYREVILMALTGAANKILNSSVSNITSKPDGTILTDMDIANEESINQIIRDAFPDARIVSEETRNIVPQDWDQGTIFFVDPLDGTKSYTFGQNFSTAGISIYRDGQPYFSGICHPYEGYIILSQHGEGTWKIPINTKTVATQMQIASMANGVMAYVDGHFVPKNTRRKLAAIDTLQQNYGSCGFRSVGSNLAQQAAVAIGQGNFTLTDAVGGFFDLSGALAIIEAGGVFVDVQTGQGVTPSTHVAIGGHPEITNMVTSKIADIYREYKGFK